PEKPHEIRRAPGPRSRPRSRPAHRGRQAARCRLRYARKPNRFRPGTRGHSSRSLTLYNRWGVPPTLCAPTREACSLTFKAPLQRSIAVGGNTPVQFPTSFDTPVANRALGRRTSRGGHHRDPTTRLLVALFANGRGIRRQLLGDLTTREEASS